MDTELRIDGSDLKTAETASCADSTGTDSKDTACRSRARALPPVKLYPYRTTGRLFACAVALQMVAVVGLAVPRVMALVTCPTVTLKPVPVDPYDFFRGTYVDLNYDISRLKGATGMQQGKPVYVVLKKGNPTWTLAYHSVLRPKAKADEMVLKGKIKWVSGDEASVSYGAERLYVPEGKGRELESRQKEMRVEIAVDKDGNASIKRVFMKEKLLMDASELFHPQLADL